MSKPELPWVETNKIMLNAGFTPEQIRLALIWAAKNKTCTACLAPPYQPCKNLHDLKSSSFFMARENKYPHQQRINYDRLKKELNYRGYK